MLQLTLMGVTTDPDRGTVVTVVTDLDFPHFLRCAMESEAKKILNTREMFRQHA